MTKYNVVVPVTGYVGIEVEANSPQEALKNTAKEMSLRVKDLNGYDAQDASNVEHEIFVLRDDANIQVFDLDDPHGDNNMSLIPMIEYHKVVK